MTTFPHPLSEWENCIVNPVLDSKIQELSFTMAPFLPLGYQNGLLFISKKFKYRGG